MKALSFHLKKKKKKKKRKEKKREKKNGPNISRFSNFKELILHG
jgi:hypothetical protein